MYLNYEKNYNSYKSEIHIVTIVSIYNLYTYLYSRIEIISNICTQLPQVLKCAFRITIYAHSHIE